MREGGADVGFDRAQCSMQGGPSGRSSPRETVSGPPQYRLMSADARLYLIHNFSFFYYIFYRVNFY